MSELIRKSERASKQRHYDSPVRAQEAGANASSSSSSVEYEPSPEKKRLRKSTATAEEDLLTPNWIAEIKSLILPAADVAPILFQTWMRRSTNETVTFIYQASLKECLLNHISTNIVPGVKTERGLKQHDGVKSVNRVKLLGTVPRGAISTLHGRCTSFPPASATETFICIRTDKSRMIREVDEKKTRTTHILEHPCTFQFVVRDINDPHNLVLRLIGNLIFTLAQKAIAIP